MHISDQGTSPTPRYSVIPRTLVFLKHGEDLLLLRGAPDKRLWAGKLNGVGGHVEPGEDPLTGARREVREETGFCVDALALRALIHVSGGEGHAGVLLFVFVGEAPSRRPPNAGDRWDSREGTLAWCPRDALPLDDLVDDLPHLLPRILGGDGITYARYTPDASGRLATRFVDGA